MSTSADVLNESASPVYLDQLPRHFRAWFYGMPGSGKTELAGKIVDLYDAPAGLISTDSAWVTLLKNESAAKKIIRYPFQGFSQIEAIVDNALKGVEPYCNFSTLIWDTVSTAIDMYIANLVKAKPFNDQRDRDLPSWSHFNLASQKLKPTVDALSKAPFNVIYLSHVREPSEADTKKSIFAIRPNTPEACFKQIAQEVQLIGWLNKSRTGGSRILQVEGTNTEVAKSQVPSIPEGKYPVEEIPELIRRWQELSSPEQVAFNIDDEGV